MMPLLGIVAEIQNFLRITKINLGETSNERGECIFIPLKIAKRKRYKNTVDGVVLAAIQIAEDPIYRRTDGASAFNTPTARGRLLLLDPARGEEKLRESSGSTTAWWWSLRFSCRASPSTTTTEEVLGRKRVAPGKGCGSHVPPHYI